MKLFTFFLLFLSQVLAYEYFEEEQEDHAEVKRSLRGYEYGGSYEYWDYIQTSAPTEKVTKYPTPYPTAFPTKFPSKAPGWSKKPSKAPTKRKTFSPTTKKPSKGPTQKPSKRPTQLPTKKQTPSYAELLSFQNRVRDLCQSLKPIVANQTQPLGRRLQPKQLGQDNKPH